MTGWEKAVAHLCANAGMARRADLLELGLAHRTLQRRVASGLLMPLGPWVVALPGTSPDLATLTRAAVLGRPALVPTGLSSATLLGPGPWDEVALVGDPWLVGDDDRVTAARFLRHPGLQTVRREGIVLASPASTVVDLLRFLDHGQAERVGRAALQQRVVSIALLQQARARLGRHHGVRQLDAVIRVLVEGTHAESEHLFVQILRQAGITGWQANHCVRVGPRRYFVDVAFPGPRLAVEIDGQAHHTDSAAFQRDRRRQNDLVGSGWTVLRFTWADLVGRPDEVVSRIVATLERSTAG